ncbi:putative chromo domain-containing protein LHP1 [Aphelenchoides besseyi]|nr:putative chromo domain-containing protein LHP1 [Aphelenchoides besseyi]
MADNDPMAKMAKKVGEVFFGAVRGAVKNSASNEMVSKPESKENNANEDQSGSEAEDGVYEVDFLMDTKIKKGVRHFFVRWKGFDASYDTWEPEDNLDGAQEIVKKFMESYKPPVSVKKPRASKNSTSPKAAKEQNPIFASRKRGKPPNEVVSDIEEPEKESDDEDYGGPKLKRSQIDKTTTSQVNRPPIPTYTSVPALNMSIKQKMTTNSSLRWLEEDSSSSREASDHETNGVNGFASSSNSLPSFVVPAIEIAVKTENEPTVSNDVSEENRPSKHKSKHKKKKVNCVNRFVKRVLQNKKHSKERECPTSEDGCRLIENNNNKSETKTTLRFLGTYRPESTLNGELRFIARSNNADYDRTLSLEEAYNEDSWSLCRFLASKITFLPSGEQKIVL